MPAAAFLLLGACSLNDSSAGGTFLRLEASPQLLTYGRVTVVLGDSMGNMPDTLYDDSLPSLAALGSLPAKGYQGGKAEITIKGYRQGILAYSETRVYDGRTQRVLTLTVSKDDGPILIAVKPPDTTLAPGTVTHAPSFTGYPGDTSVSIRDSVSLASEAYDPDGDLARFAWHCDGGGIADDTGSLAGYRQKIPYGIRISNPGQYACVLTVWDKGGRQVRHTSAIKVDLDMPFADAGKDTEVVAGTCIFLHARGWDGYGPIVSRSWQIGDEPFKPVLQQETSILAPLLAGDLLCILRVTDSDSLSTLDTLRVRVLPIPGDSLAKPANPASPPGN